MKKTTPSLHIAVRLVSMLVLLTASACDPTDEGNDPAGIDDLNDTSDTASAEQIVRVVGQ